MAEPRPGIQSGLAVTGSRGTGFRPPGPLSTIRVLRVRGRALPEGEPVDLYADGDRRDADPVAGTELVAEGWLLPGLVDAHTHPGAEAPGQPLDDGLLDPGRCTPVLAP